MDTLKIVFTVFYYEAFAFRIILLLIAVFASESFGLILSQLLVSYKYFILFSMTRLLTTFWSVIVTKPILPCSYTRNLGFVFDPSLSFSQQISKLSSFCHYHIRDLRRIRNFLDHKTTATIATSLVNFRLDYCNSFY